MVGDKKEHGLRREDNGLTRRREGSSYREAKPRFCAISSNALLTLASINMRGSGYIARFAHRSGEHTFDQVIVYVESIAQEGKVALKGQCEDSSRVARFTARGNSHSLTWRSGCFIAV